MGDLRLSKRAGLIAADRFANPGGGITGLPGGAAAIKAAYRFFENKEPDLTMENILQAHITRTHQRIASEETILLPQDTTTLNFDGLKTTTGLGPVSGNQTGHHAQGMYLHSTMAILPTGIPLGFVDAICWSRLQKQEGEKGKKSKKRKKSKKGQTKAEDERPAFVDASGAVQPFSKESERWLHSYRACDRIAHLFPSKTIVSICDREGDIYFLFLEAVGPTSRAFLLVRAQYDRGVAVGGNGADAPLLWPHVLRQPAAGTRTVTVGRSQGHPERQAVCEVRYASVKLRPPTKQPNLPSLRIWAVHVKEIDPPEDGEAIEWMLLTTYSVEDFECACTMVDWYCKRWKIEEMHRILKSGCEIEDRQLKDALGLKRALAIDLVVSWRIQYLTLLARERPNLPGTAAFNDTECEVLRLITEEKHDGAPALPEKKTAESPPSPLVISDCIRAVAMLGGFLGRASDGSPGSETLWKGLKVLYWTAHVLELFCASHGIDISVPPRSPP